MKKCSKCKQQLSREDFYTSRKSPSGLTSACKKCTYSKTRQTYIAVVGKICGDCLEDKPREEYYLSKATRDGLTVYCRQCSTTRSILSRFKLSRDKHDEMMSRGCDSCGSMERLCIDHDHSCCKKKMTCGKCIRGVLCAACNSAEGFLKTSENAKNLLAYMIKNNL